MNSGVYQILNLELLNELERHYIRLFNSNNPLVGYNQTSGGDGAPNLSFETIRRRVDNFRGYKHTLEAKVKISKVHRGKVIPQEQILRAKQSRKVFTIAPEVIRRAVNNRRINGGYDWSEERRKRLGELKGGQIAPNAKAVQIFDINDNLVVEYSSIKKASLEFFQYKSPEGLKRFLQNGQGECMLHGYKVKLK